MPPEKIKPSDAKTAGLHYVTIKDFRPGIYSNVRTNAIGGIVDAEQPGMAREGTVGCIANVTGQLVPLPQGTAQVFVFEFDGAAHPLALGGAAVSVGLQTVGPTTTPGDDRADDIWFFCNYASHVSPSFWDTYRAVVIKGGTTPVVPLDAMQGVQITGTPPLNISKRGITTVFTRGRRSNFNSPGYPIFGWEYTSSGATSGTGPYQDGAVAHYNVYPDPNNLTADSYYQEAITVVNGTSNYGGQLVAHSGRIVRFCENMSPFGANVDFETNELVRYTDPPGNVVLGDNATDSILDPQNPGGYSSWGSLSFGELLLIKRSGGALLIEGDLYAPQVTRLPGVADVGNLTNVAIATPIGLVYCCQDDGAYVWNGGSSSQKLSTISDRFAIPPQLMHWGIKTGMTLWNNWIVFANGWLYDTVTQGWWQLDASQALPPGSDGIQWAAAGKGSPRYLYVTCGDLTTFDTVDHNAAAIGVYDIETASTQYTWMSQPLAVSYGHAIDIREICLTLSNIESGALIEVFFQTLEGTVTQAEPFVISFATSGPVRLRKPVGVQGESVMLTVVAKSLPTGQPAPTLNAIEIGYLPAQPFAQSWPYA